MVRITPPFISDKKAIWKGCLATPLGGFIKIIDHGYQPLTSHGMILQEGTGSRDTLPSRGLAGERAENWDAKTSRAVQVLISIQSLILVPQPYFNEPGLMFAFLLPAIEKSTWSAICIHLLYIQFFPFLLFPHSLAEFIKPPLCCAPYSAVFPAQFF